MEDLINLNEIDDSVLAILLTDKTTGQNIIWATDSYEDLGAGYHIDEEIQLDQVRSSDLIQPRIQKSLEVQKERTKKNAEVFTPAWVCNLMNSQAEEEWFGTTEVFNQRTGKGWITKTEPIKFVKNGKEPWKKYIQQKVLEITCGEAPFLVSRYDSSTGESIEVKDRIGLLDRKLRIVTEHTKDSKTWYEFARRALKHTYGYEFQGDSLLIGRVNVYLTFVETFQSIWNEELTLKQQMEIAEIISWNLFQMDGLTDCIPTGIPEDQYYQATLFDLFEPEEKKTSPLTIVNWWSGNKRKTTIRAIKEGNDMSGSQRFSVCLGNPPYQENSKGQNASDTPVYHLFFNEASKIAEATELITPARFLFNAGGTPKFWNEERLNDPHFKVLEYYPKSSTVFPTTDVKGGVAVIYQDKTRTFNPIKVFTASSELDSILQKVKAKSTESLMDKVSNRGLYRFSALAYKEVPEEMKKTADSRIAPSSFDRMPRILSKEKPEDGREYIQLLGKTKSGREYRWIRKDYVKETSNLGKYKVILPKANGSGAIGEALSTPLIGTPLIGTPLIGFTETYISINATSSKNVAENTLKYIKSKFARTMLGVLKVTQNNAKPTWAEVPMQNFTDRSDIDWSNSIPEIDQQLYKKYGLSPEEIEFIETHVKEME